jgi:fructokinase
MLPQAPVENSAAQTKIPMRWVRSMTPCCANRLIPFGPFSSGIRPFSIEDAQNARGPLHYLSMRIGVDVGGTKIAVAAVAPSGDIAALKRAAAPQDYDQLLLSLRELITHLEVEVGVTLSVGLGTPGAPSPTTGLMRNAYTSAIQGKPFAHDLERVLGRSVRLANDANCFAVSEAKGGAGQGAETVFGVIVGTGTGGGLVVRGRALSGINAIAGEWGHNPLPWPHPDELPGDPCSCGKRGCIESFLSGPALEHDHVRHTGHVVSSRELAERAQGGDPACVAPLERYAERMARSLATVINVVDPDVIVLGGGLSQIAALYELVPRSWGRYVLADSVATRLVPSRFGDASGVRGAAWLWSEDA